MKKILSIGEATIDSFVFVHDASVRCTVDKSRCEFCLNYADKILADNTVLTVGGNAANTAVSFARLGLESQLFSIRGDDWLGERVQQTLEAEKVDCRYVQVEKGPTSYATAIVFNGERTEMIYHVTRDYQLPSFEPADWLYLTSMGKAYASAYEAVRHYLQQHGAKMSFNPGSYQLKSGVTSLKPLLELTEALFVNREEAQHMTELPASAGVRELAEALFDLGPKIINITDGPKGAYCFNGHELLFCDIFPAEVVERTGAGDAYAAGFTAALLRDQPVDEAMRWGMANSAGVIKEIGPQGGLLTKDLMAEVLNDNHTVVPQLFRR